MPDEHVNLQIGHAKKRIDITPAARFTRLFFFGTQSIYMRRERVGLWEELSKNSASQGPFLD
jgi:hypothetical protein